MQQYAKYEAEDFVRDDEFIRWILSPDETSHAFWKLFLETYPFQAAHVGQAKATVLTLHAASAAQPDSRDAGEIWAAIERDIQSRKGRTIALWKWSAGAAAVVLLAVCIQFWSGGDQGYKKLSLRDFVLSETVFVNREAKDVKFLLPDNSKVVIKPGGRLEFSSDFLKDQREVRLEGEAFFDVTHDKERPFIVYTKDLTVRVLGTSFTVAESGGNVKVAVKTGRVSVFRKKGNESEASADPLVLKPNEQVAYVKGALALEKSIVADPMPLLEDISFQDFVFKSESVPVIFEAMEEAYGIELDYDASMLAGCRLTTSLGKETLFEKLDVICAAIGADYRIDGSRIVVNGKKCE